ncbi:MAG: ribbon-helix-helix protein, CopG family [Acidobacteriota bacterium]
MANTTITISERSQKTLNELATQTGEPIEQIIEQALEQYFKALQLYARGFFINEVNAGYAKLRSDPQAWKEELEERAVWDNTLMDGLDPDEQWTEDGNVITRDNH